MENINEIPTIKDIIEKLDKILNNEISREKVSNWAGKFILNEKLDIKDKEKEWEFLKKIFRVNVKGLSDKYLHNEEELKKWVEIYKLFLDECYS